jgi:hypothetical protein
MRASISSWKAVVFELALGRNVLSKSRSDQRTDHDCDWSADQTEPREEPLEWTAVANALHQKKRTDVSEIDQEEPSAQEVARRTAPGDCHQWPPLFVVLIGAGRSQDQ